MDKFKVLFVDDEQELVSTLVERLQYRDILGAFLAQANEITVHLHGFFHASPPG